MAFLEVDDVSKMEGKDLQAARLSVIKLLTHAQQGQQFSSIFDKKQCHEAFSYTGANGVERKVWRLWLSGAVRIYFVYLSTRRIVVLKIASKRVDRLSQGDMQEISALADVAYQSDDDQFDLKIYG